MATSSAPYVGFLLGLPKAQFNLLGGSVTIALVDTTYLPDLVNHVYLSSVTGLLSTASPIALTGVTLTYDSTLFAVVAKAGSVLWASASFTVRWAVIYQNSGTASTSPLIGLIDFGTERTYSSEDMTLNFTNGFVQLPAS